MFEGVDRQPAAPSGPSAPVAPPVIMPPPTAVPPIAPPTAMMAEPASGFGAGKILLVIVAGLLVMGTSGYIAYRFMVQPADDLDSGIDTGVGDEIVDDTVETDQPDDSDTAEAPVEEDEEATRINPATLLDSDGDGLTNAKELESGTSITKADTDGDGLGDREEIEVYGTDPKDVDTDGDTYLDGQEVAGGYNPNGSGRLFTVPEEGSGS